MFNNILNWENIYSFCAIHSYFESVTCDCLKLCWTQALNIVKHRLHVCWGVMYRVWIPGAALTMWPEQRSTWAMPGLGDATLTSVTPHFTTRTAWITDSLIILLDNTAMHIDTKTNAGACHFDPCWSSSSTILCFCSALVSTSTVSIYTAQMLPYRVEPVCMLTNFFQGQ